MAVKYHIAVVILDDDRALRGDERVLRGAALGQKDRHGADQPGALDRGGAAVDEHV
jgi:hypothetical protein